MVFWKCERKTELRRPSGMWKDNIKMGIKELCCGCVKRICVAQCGQVAWRGVLCCVVADTTVVV